MVCNFWVQYEERNGAGAVLGLTGAATAGRDQGLLGAATLCLHTRGAEAGAEPVPAPSRGGSPQGAVHSWQNTEGSRISATGELVNPVLLYPS